MDIAVISDGTFNEKFYKDYIEESGNTLACIINKDEEFPTGNYDAILLDYYNEGLNLKKIQDISEENLEAIFCILADIDINHSDFKKEEQLMYKFKVEYATCYNIKEADPKDFTDFIKAMQEVKDESKNIELPFDKTVVLSVLGIVALIIIGILHYIH